MGADSPGWLQGDTAAPVGRPEFRRGESGALAPLTAHCRSALLRQRGTLLLAALGPRLARTSRGTGARILKHVGEAAVAAVLPVIVRRHEDTRAARGAGRPQPR